MNNVRLPGYASIMASSRQHARSVVIGLQKKLGIFPRQFCLISGAPRSGTSAMSDWLSSQREVAGFKESRLLIAIHGFVEQAGRFRTLEQDRQDLVSMARRLACEYYGSRSIMLGRSLIVEKEPLEPIAFPDKRYNTFLDHVRTVFPGARFLFMIRDPVATVFSMRQREWGQSLKTAEPRTFSLEEHVENWCSCVDCILRYADDPDTYICQYGRLINEPERESRRIFDFLDLHNGKLFQPRNTKTVQFSEQERLLIMDRARPQIDALYARGISEFG